MDSFLWLRIASFIGEYVDLCALSCTCRELHQVCNELKPNYQAHHISLIHQKAKELSSLVNIFKTMTYKQRCISEKYVDARVSQFAELTQSITLNYSDANFIDALLLSEQQALLTCVKRDIHIPSFKCLKFHVYTSNNNKVKVDTTIYDPKVFCFNHLHPSILSYAFSEDLVIQEPNFIVDSEMYCNRLYCYLYFKEQPTPPDNMYVTATNSANVCFLIFKDGMYHFKDDPFNGKQRKDWKNDLFVCKMSPIAHEIS